MTIKQSVEKLIRSRRWISSDEIREIGGTSALRRLRELRADGYEIATRRQDGTYQYRMTARPS